MDRVYTCLKDIQKMNVVTVSVEANAQDTQWKIQSLV